MDQKSRAFLSASLVVLVLSSTGCVSSKYKPAPKDTPPPVQLNLAAETPSASAVVHTVIVFKGPGSWKKQAYWDEYVVSIRNNGDEPLEILSVALVDELAASRAPGTEPWALEKASRRELKVATRYGRAIVIGAGTTALWAASYSVAAFSAFAGASSAFAVSAATFFAIPVFALGSGVRTIAARREIMEEFNRRRIGFPIALAPGETRSGSIFFPVTPGPRQLVLRHRQGDATGELVIDLAPLAGLHLAPASGSQASGG